MGRKRKMEADWHDMPAWNKERYDRGSAILDAYKASHPCAHCGEADPICLDFHHLGDKSLSIAKARRYTVARLEAELAKCVMLCANCHRKLHAGRFTI